MTNFDAAAAIDALIDVDHPIKRKNAEWAVENLDDPELIERDRDCRFWPEGWQRAAERGITGLMVDPAYGGGGHDVIHALLAFEGLGYGCRDAGLLFGLSTQVWTMQPLIERFGTEDQKRRYLPGLCSGELRAALCITEAESGSDTFAMGTGFRTDETSQGTEGSPGDGSSRPSFVLSGTKSYITLAPVADLFIVFATSDPALGQWGGDGLHRRRRQCRRDGRPQPPQDGTADNSVRRCHLR